MSRTCIFSSDLFFYLKEQTKKPTDVLTDFFLQIRGNGVPASIKEYLTLLEAMAHNLAECSIDDFYQIARITLVKNETHYDRFDKAFSSYFDGIESIPDEVFGEIPKNWVEKLKQLDLTDEEKKEIQALGGWEKLMETLKKRLEEQKKRHQGGSKWIGTAGTSPFGAYGFNPAGVRIGQSGSRGRSAVKVWDKREFRNLDDNVEIGTRNIKVALKRLRRFARVGAADQFDLDGTVNSTARNAGYLDIKMIPERRNAVKVLLFFDVGGSMEDYVRICEELFSAAKTEFKHLEYYYFHNFVYESVWKDSRRRGSERTPMMEVLNKYGQDYKLIFVGDATMSPYEIMYPGGSVEHFNEEAGSEWLKRMLDVYSKVAWLNPTPTERWGYYESIGIIKKLLNNRMYSLTLGGLDSAIKNLVR